MAVFFKKLFELIRQHEFSISNLDLYLPEQGYSECMIFLPACGSQAFCNRPKSKQKGLPVQTPPSNSAQAGLPRSFYK